MALNEHEIKPINLVFPFGLPLKTVEDTYFDLLYLVNEGNFERTYEHMKDMAFKSVNHSLLVSFILGMFYYKNLQKDQPWNDQLMRPAYMAGLLVDSMQKTKEM